MIENASGNIDYSETGAGPTIVLVPGSCSTGAAWRPVIAALGDQYRCVTTSLLGYGGTAERRTAADTSISHEAEALETVIGMTGSRVHLVGHSYGGLVALAAALRNRANLASLTILEAPAVGILKGRHEQDYQAFRAMTDSYFAAFRSGEADAIAAMIDFYGGDGTFASWPPRVRAYAVKTTSTNILDWASAYGFALSTAALGTIGIPVLVAWGSRSQPAVQRANALLAQSIEGAASFPIQNVSHFMIASHPDVIAASIAEQTRRFDRAVRHVV